MLARSFVPRLQIVAAVLMVATLAACGGDRGNRISDASGRISFELPDGWTEAAGSGGTRFNSPASPGAQVQINTVDDNGRAPLSARRDAWLDFHRRNGATVHLEREWPGAYLDGIEYAHDAETAAGRIVWHHVLLSGEGYVVTTYLQAPPGAYETVLPIFRDMVGSIRPASLNED